MSAPTRITISAELSKKLISAVTHALFETALGELFPNKVELLAVFGNGNEFDLELGGLAEYELTAVWALMISLPENDPEIHKLKAQIGAACHFLFRMSPLERLADTAE